MKTRAIRQGRPAKEGNLRKEDYLDIRLNGVEKKAFRDAAEAAGLDLSAWVRSRLRAVSRKELVEAHRPVAFDGVSKRAVHPLIEKTKGVCGGVARIAGTRFPVWLIEEMRIKGYRKQDLIKLYPSLKKEQIEAAMAYAQDHVDEIYRSIKENG